MPAFEMCISSAGVYFLAECADVNGHRSLLDLNDCLANKKGRLRWTTGGNFAMSARHMRLVNDGKRFVPVVADPDRNWAEKWVSLNRRITNENGVLKVL